MTLARLKDLVARGPRRVRPSVRVAVYSPANLNTMDGSAIWVESAVRTLHVDPRLAITVVLKAPVKRSIISASLGRLTRVQLVLPQHDAPLATAQAIERLIELDRDDPFDIVVIRGFDVCLEAVRRHAFDGRLWACYILEPERDVGAAAYRNALREIADAAHLVLVQSEAMAEVLTDLVPMATERLAFLPPAVAADTPVADPRDARHRLAYAGKFHPFYRIHELIDAFIAVRSSRPKLAFEVIGDKVFQPPGDPDWARMTRQRLRSTPGLVWRGALARRETLRLLARGALAVSIWDYRHGAKMNDLVISTKLLDYGIVGLPVLLSRTTTQESLLGVDYPLFVAPSADLPTTIAAALDAHDLLIEASQRTRAMGLRFTYERVHAGLAPAIDGIARSKGPSRSAPRVSAGGLTSQDADDEAKA